MIYARGTAKWEELVSTTMQPESSATLTADKKPEEVSKIGSFMWVSALVLVLTFIARNNPCPCSYQHVRPVHAGAFSRSFFTDAELVWRCGCLIPPPLLCLYLYQCGIRQILSFLLYSNSDRKRLTGAFSKHWIDFKAIVVSSPEHKIILAHVQIVY